MLSHLPFFRRVARPILVRPGFWVVTVLLGLFTMAVRLETPSLLGFFGILAAVFSGVTTMRSLDDDQASGTLEQLDVLPVPRWRIALEIAAGSLAAYVCLAAVAIALGLFRSTGPVQWVEVINALPAIIGLPLLGTIVPLRHGMRWYKQLLAGALLCFVVNQCGEHIFPRRPPTTLEAALFRTLVFTGLIAVLWGSAWFAAHVFGGGWSAQDAAPPVRAEGSSAAGGARVESGTPDGFNPLFWREVCTGHRFLALFFVLGLLYIGGGLSSDHRWDQPMSRASQCMFWIFLWACLTSSMRTASDRLSGMWADLAVAPIPRRTILWSRVRGMVVQAMVVGGLWLLAGYLISPERTTGADALWGGLAGYAMLLLGVLAAILSGFLTGTSGRGLVAGVGGLVLMYFLAMVSWIPAGIMGMFVEANLRHQDPVIGVIFVTAGVIGTGVIFYGTLIYGSMWGISRAVEEQRG